MEGEVPNRQEVVEFSFRPMQQSDADAIAAWRYPREYSFYDWASEDPDDLAKFLDPTARGDDYVAVEEEAGSLIGWFHFKRPHGPTVEIGLGLHPEWTGQGLGNGFVEAGLEYARRRFAPKQFTLSVASFNRRAIIVYERAGFAVARVYTHWTAGADWEFIEMTRPA